MTEHDVNIYSSSDYAGISTENASFYYGYEHSICADCGKKNNGEYCDNCEGADRYWCFVANIGDKEITIPSNKLGCDGLHAKDMFDVCSCLMQGIAIILTQYKLTL